MSKHTPGPWWIKTWSGDEAFVIGRINGKDAHITMTCMRQDARLIAAAPDLLAVAQYAEAILADVFRGAVDPVAALDAISDLAKPAIAKADSQS